MSIEVVGFDELLKKLEKLSDPAQVEAICRKAVDAGKPMNEAAVRSAVASVETGPYSTGSIASSISSTDTRVNELGVYAVARPTGRDKKGVLNAEKAAYLQYGTSRMSAKPWRQNAIASAASCEKVMEEVIKAEMELE